MVTLVGELVFLKHVYKLCEIAVAGKKTMADVIVLDLLKFDVILGIDW